MEKELRLKLGKKIRSLRKGLRFTQEELAEKTDIDYDPVKYSVAFRD